MRVCEEGAYKLTEKHHETLRIPHERVVGLSGGVCVIVIERRIFKGANWTDETGSYSINEKRALKRPLPGLDFDVFANWDHE